MYMFLYSVIILKTPSFIVLPHIFNSYDSLIKQYTPNHVDFNTFFRTTHEIHIKILQIGEPSLLYPKKTKNPNPSPIGNRFGFFLFGGRGWIARAALLKTAHWAVFALSSATAPQLFESTRSMSLTSSQNKNLSVLVYVEAFWWARVDSNHRS